jgi:DNA invertase Pin-like site-specific DNA recombinase
VSRISRPEYLDEGRVILNKLLSRNLAIVDVFSNKIINRENQTDMLLLFIDLMKAKGERDSIKMRTRNGTKNRMNTGYRCYSAPAGYRMEKITINKKTNSIVVRNEPHASYIKE